MKRMLVLTALLVTVLTLFAFPIPARAGPAIYYVSPTGDDSTGDGSEGTPWRTITKADFDRNGIINISDFGLLAVNYMRISPIDISG